MQSPIAGKRDRTGLLLHSLGRDSSNWGNVGLGLCRGNLSWRHPSARAEERKEREGAAAISPSGNREKAGNGALVPALPQCSSCLPRRVGSMTQHQALADSCCELLIPQANTAVSTKPAQSTQQTASALGAATQRHTEKAAAEDQPQLTWL